MCERREESMEESLVAENVDEPIITTGTRQGRQLDDRGPTDDNDDDRLPPNHGPLSPSVALSFTPLLILAVHLDDVVGQPLVESGKSAPIRQPPPANGSMSPNLVHESRGHFDIFSLDCWTLGLVIRW
ncbi:hypothetical protein B0T20DRAFT_395722 [Sordaria brevicollis]|uniref:Uncharacterized protein n=1 Tax=Sordaria brevicollis TaxID=83679 RepID=A0AAE0P9W4_SORBR|nr:hypothetical protein B0T20DRAFT_395722 [Sordaria brevicollis]